VEDHLSQTVSASSRIVAGVRALAIQKNLVFRGYGATAS
jgi:hypothetical protein